MKNLSFSVTLIDNILTIEPCAAIFCLKFSFQTRLLTMLLFLIKPKFLIHNRTQHLLRKKESNNVNFYYLSNNYCYTYTTPFIARYHTFLAGQRIHFYTLYYNIFYPLEQFKKPHIVICVFEIFLLTPHLVKLCLVHL